MKNAIRFEESEMTLRAALEQLDEAIDGLEDLSLQAAPAPVKKSPWQSQALSRIDSMIEKIQSSLAALEQPEPLEAAS